MLVGSNNDTNEVRVFVSKDLKREREREREREKVKYYCNYMQMCYMATLLYHLYTVQLINFEGLKFRILSLFSIFRKFCAVFYFVGACHFHSIIQVW